MIAGGRRPWPGLSHFVTMLSLHNWNVLLRITSVHAFFHELKNPSKFVPTFHHHCQNCFTITNSSFPPFNLGMSIETHCNFTSSMMAITRQLFKCQCNHLTMPTMQQPPSVNNILNHHHHNVQQDVTILYYLHCMPSHQCVNKAIKTVVEIPPLK